MAPKGLSLDEKRKRMLDIFYDSKDVFLLKDLEKIAPKQKGITMQSVKVRFQNLNWFFNLELNETTLGRAWVSMGVAGAWHPPKFWTSPLAPADFETLYTTNWHPQSSFYVCSKWHPQFQIPNSSPGEHSHMTSDVFGVFLTHLPTLIRCFTT